MSDGAWIGVITFAVTLGTIGIYLGIEGRERPNTVYAKEGE